MGTTLVYAAFAAIVLISVASHLRKMKRRERAARVSAEHGRLFSEGPRAQHPHIDATQCIGCGACVEVCPEGDVLAVIGGQGGSVNGDEVIRPRVVAVVGPAGPLTIA